MPEPVAAYLDPGSGSMLLQGVIAVLAATMAAVSVYWRNIRGVIGRLLGRKTSTPDAD